ncbi:MAG: hypothetical protein K9J27_01735 [Bacteroidales bacterium]|nr:hypothetical protein [Bacteroidales bacterium]
MNHQKQPLPLRKHRDLGDTISATFEFIRYNFKNLLKIILFFAGPWYLASAILSSFFYSNIGNMAYVDGQFSWLNLLSGFLSGVATLVAILSIYSYIRLYLEYGYDNSKISLSTVKSYMLQNLGSFIGAGLLITLIMIVGFFLLVLPGIYFGIALSVTLVALMIEDLGVGDAISRSWNLIKGNWWVTFGLILLLIIIQAIIVYAVIMPFGALFGFSIFSIAQEQTVTNAHIAISILFALVNAFVSLLAQMIPTVGIAMHYFSIVEKKEGAGLREQIENMGSEQTL